MHAVTIHERRSGGAAIDLVCHQCVRKFTSHAALKRHIESKHTQNLVTFSCDLCSKPFKTKWSLSTHTSRFHRRANDDGGHNTSGGAGGVATVAVSPTTGTSSATTATTTSTTQTPTAMSDAEGAAKTMAVVATRRLKMEVSQ